jgi:hypothetical protein
MNAAKSVTATFTIKTATVEVTKEGPGSGTIASNPVGITCGGTCSHTYNHGQQVVLTATRDANSDQTAVAWTGCDSSTATTCTVTVNGAENVGAKFTLNSYQLSVDTQGNGNGKVVSNVGSIDCPDNDCNDSYNHNQPVVLTATNAGDSDQTEVEWTGCDSETATTCTVTMNGAKNVTATFTLDTYDVSVTVNGDGSVTSAPGDIACPGDCSSEFDHNDDITLTAHAVDGVSTFTGWTNCPDESGNECTISNIAADHSNITATFEAVPTP